MAEFRLPLSSRPRQGESHSAKKGAQGPFLNVSVYRYRPGDDRPRIDDYVAPQSALGPMVLDLLFYLKNEIDGSLSFRRSCREGVCGSCAMNINGRNRLACITPLAEQGQQLRINPLPQLPVLCDLVSDMRHFYAQHAALEPWLKNTDTLPADGRERLQSPADRALLDGLYECVLCACCSTSCPSYWWNGDRYLGPASLLQAYRWVVDSRDNNREERLDALHDPFKLYRCHTIMNCAEACPKNLNPAAAIAALKRNLLERH